MEVFIFLKSSTREQDRRTSSYPLASWVDTRSTGKSAGQQSLTRALYSFGNEFSKNSTRTFWKGLKSYSELNRKCSKLNSKMEAFMSCSILSNLNRKFG